MKLTNPSKFKIFRKELTSGISNLFWAIKPRNCRCRIYLFFYEPMRSTFCLLNKQMLTKFCSHCVKIVSNDKFGLVNQLFTKWEMSIVLVTYFWFALSGPLCVRSCFFTYIMFLYHNATSNYHGAEVSHEYLRTRYNLRHQKLPITFNHYFMIICMKEHVLLCEIVLGHIVNNLGLLNVQKNIILPQYWPQSHKSENWKI